MPVSPTSGEHVGSIAETFNRAMALHRLGDLAQAESLYYRILAIDANHFEALHFLGLVSAQRGQFEEARRLMCRSLEINTQTADAYANYARVLNKLKCSDEAIAACDQALAISSRSIEALVSRGIALYDL